MPVPSTSVQEQSAVLRSCTRRLGASEYIYKYLAPRTVCGFAKLYAKTLSIGAYYAELQICIINAKSKLAYEIRHQFIYPFENVCMIKRHQQFYDDHRWLALLRVSAWGVLFKLLEEDADASMLFLGNQPPDQIGEHLECPQRTTTSSSII